MKYIVDSKEVSRDTFYFCQKAKEENKSFVFINNNICEVTENYINNHPEYDYYICEEASIYFVKGEEIVEEWYEKDSGLTKVTLEDIAKRYAKSKFKDTMTLEDWYTKNGWEYKCETKYKGECHDIPTVEDFKEEGVRIKLFSVTVDNGDTVKTINKIRNERGNFCVKYVLRNGAYTEIIYEDTYKEV